MRVKRRQQAGFSIIELLVVLAIAGVIAAMALPSAERTLADVRMHNDARAIHSLLSLAKMRASSKYTRVRLHCDFGNETYVLENFDKVTQTWVSEENPEALSANIDFDFNGLSDPPDDTQNAIHEALACKADDGVTDIPNSGCIVFNSRG